MVNINKSLVSFDAQSHLGYSRSFGFGHGSGPGFGSGLGSGCGHSFGHSFGDGFGADTTVDFEEIKNGRTP